MAMFNGLRTEPVYNTRAVANQTGVPADTFRAWERRYHLPSPCRSLGNQRLYSDRDVAIIIWLRDQTRSGMTIRHAVALFVSLDQQLETTAKSADVATPGPIEILAIESSVSIPSSTDERPSFFETCLGLIQALTDFNASAAERIVEEVNASTPVEMVCHEVLRPSMDEIRRRRQRGEVSLSVERFAQAFIQRKIHVLFNLSHPEEGRGPVMTAGVEGDHDDLDLLFLSLFLSRNGFSVVYLGTDVAAQELQSAISALNPVLVLLNASSETVAPALDQTLRTLVPDEGAEQKRVVGVTGSLFSDKPDLQREIRAPYIDINGFRAVATCDRLLDAVLSGD